MPKSITITLILTIMFGMLLAACNRSANLEGTSWQLSALNGQTLPGNIFINLVFEDGRVGGTAACNHYGAAYQLKGDQLTIEIPESTLMYCEGVMDYESEYLQTLPQVASYQQTQDQLIMLDSSGSQVLVFEKPQAPDLEGTSWKVTKIGEMTVPQWIEISMAFAEGKLNGIAACNRYFADFSQDGNLLSITNAGATEMFCAEEGVMEYEAAFLQALQDVRQVRQVGEGLALLDASGKIPLISLIP